MDGKPICASNENTFNYLQSCAVEYMYDMTKTLSTNNISESLSTQLDENRRIKMMLYSYFGHTVGPNTVTITESHY